MVIVVPSLTAIGAAIWAVGHPTLSIRRGLVVGQRSIWYAVLNGVIGGVVVLCVLAGLVFIAVWVWYRLLGGDRVWEAIYRGRRGQIYFFVLRCKENVGAVNPVHLGAVQCWVRTPTGSVWEYPGTEEKGWASPNGVGALVRTDDGPGRYEVRWYSTREGERRREVARQRVTISDDEPDEAGTDGQPWLERRR